ncbi:MAG: glycosyltransferase family 2 protein [Planctomycetaceae bacterium]|nr:glycosyltransferase family 2 protein [Planctomycetaceae bacterium]
MPSNTAFPAVAPVSPARAQASSAIVPISVLIAVRNEVKNLGRCLEPLQGWADEVVVVDSQSSDGTIELAQAAGATVVQFHYQGGWPKKRQWALETHGWKNDWILLLDADEILLPEVKAEIAAAIRDEQYAGYWLQFQIVFLGRMLRHGDTRLWKRCLFRRGRGRYERRLEQQDARMADMEVHEHVVVEGPTRRLCSPVRHENWNSLHRYIEKHNEYSTWEANVQLYGSDDELRPSLFGTQAQRRRWLKRTFMRLPGAPWLRFLYVYVFRMGFLDGRAGLTYAMFKMVQSFHVKAKVRELQQAEQLPDRR